ncbi:MAG: histidine phosphatase family protein [Anaerolineales bacterium]|jgi:alpha-ribazole phosphatase|nr:MAG: histidine phosphatase family protein [Anaerolineales bacterium]
MTTLILIRHGETDWNIEGRYTGQSDVPLNARGLEQAGSLAKQLQGRKIDVIYSSDLRRAYQTAEALAESSGTRILIDPRLREIHQGEWEGMLFKDIRASYSQAWEQRARDPLLVAPPGGETVGQVRTRVLEALREILQQHPDGHLAIVSHGLVLALIKVHIAGLPIETVWDHIPNNAEPETMVMEAV